MPAGRRGQSRNGPPVSVGSVKERAAADHRSMIGHELAP